MAIQALVEAFKDPYQQKARVFPGLLTALPLLVPLVWILGPKNPVLTLLVTLATSCGAIYGLASMARGMGKRLEERLVKKWGGMPTTTMLRCRDDYLDSYSKGRYRTSIEAKLAVKLPTESDERSDPVTADQIYAGVARHLRELTRGKEHALLLKENIAYGFHRNMLAMKPLGLATSAIGVLIGLFLCGAMAYPNAAIHVDKLLNPGPSGGITLFVSFAIFVSWLYFTEAHLKRIAFTYAERLFEAIPIVKQQRTRARSEGKGSAPGA